MPTRYLKPGIRDSDPIDSLSPLAENLFYRLLVTVDDFGRYDARPSMIKAHCYPIKDSVTADICAGLMAELQQASLIDLYSANGKACLQMRKWDNKPRATESKFPPFNAESVQMHTDVYIPHTNLPLTVTVTETKTVNKKEPPAKASLDVFFDNFWNAYPRKVARDDAKKAFGKRKPTKELLTTMLSAIAEQANSDAWKKDGGQFIPHPSTWLNQGRWQDETSGAAQSQSGILAGAI